MYQPPYNLAHVPENPLPAQEHFVLQANAIYPALPAFPAAFLRRRKPEPLVAASRKQLAGRVNEGWQGATIRSYGGAAEAGSILE